MEKCPENRASWTASSLRLGLAGLGGGITVASVDRLGDRVGDRRGDEANRDQTGDLLLQALGSLRHCGAGFQSASMPGPGVLGSRLETAL